MATQYGGIHPRPPRPATQPPNLVSQSPHYTGCRAECIEIIEDHGWGLFFASATP
jgi:hypothetical protein